MGCKSNRWSRITLRIALAIFSRSPSVYSAFRSLGIIQLPCSKTVKGYMNQTCKSPGIIEDNFLLNSKRYEEYIEKRKRLGFVSPKHEGILIWDETKVESGIVWNSKNSSIVGYAVSSEEFANLHDIYEELDRNEGSQITTYILKFFWGDLTSDFDVIGPHFFSFWFHRMSPLVLYGYSNNACFSCLQHSCSNFTL